MAKSQIALNKSAKKVLVKWGYKENKDYVDCVNDIWFCPRTPISKSDFKKLKRDIKEAK